eukprot:7359122-Pyramimonas_sp.AAC.2
MVLPVVKYGAALIGRLGKALGYMGALEGALTAKPLIELIEECTDLVAAANGGPTPSAAPVAYTL